MTEPVRVADTLVKLPARIARAILTGEMVIEPYDPKWRVESPEEARERQEDALAARLRMYHVRKAYAGARYADLTPDQDPDGMVTRWWAEGGESLLIRSEITGNGKTHAAFAIGNEVVRDPGVWTAAWSMSELNRAIRPEGDPSAYDVACECSLLIIDDFGAEKMSDWTVEQLRDVLSARKGNGNRTVFTTNLGAEELFERYGDRIVGRIIDDGWTARFTGPSRRSARPLW